MVMMRFSAGRWEHIGPVRSGIDPGAVSDGFKMQRLSQLNDPNLHFVPIDYARSRRDDYLPTQLTSEDYPNLIAPGQQVDTLASEAILASYNNWQPSSGDRYRWGGATGRYFLLPRGAIAAAAIPSQMARACDRSNRFGLDPHPTGAGMARQERRAGGNPGGQTAR